MTDPTALPTFGPAGGTPGNPSGESPVEGSDAAMNNDLQERVMRVLQNFGTNPEIDADGDIALTADENRLFVRCFPGELQAMQFSGHWNVPEQVEHDLQRQLEACNAINMGLHLVKVGLVNGTLVVAVELIADTDEALPGMVHISISQILSAVRLWHENVLGLEPGSTFVDPADAEEPPPGENPHAGKSTEDI